MAMILVAPILIYLTGTLVKLISKYLGTYLGLLKDSALDAAAKMSEWEYSNRRDSFADSVNGDKPRPTLTHLNAKIVEMRSSPTLNAEVEATQTKAPFGES